ncbi:hypothetical protein ACF09C_33110 [Streptomyces sp. NPDC014870]|uniref:hypothetical protein n=1 Tax=Streptomyces sp. NPDC014870 TaxID=3364925 RepID=UPI0036F7B780
MADEQDRWLDQEAAESLFRGEAVDPVDDHTRAEADRLARALAEIRPAPLAHAVDVELPGEAAALAAFRAAAAERGATVRSAAHASYVPHTTASAVAELGAVRISRAQNARRWGRSLRYGLAAAVAAVAVGGVAVASGSGMLPFTTDGPTPAGSVSAADTPGPVSSYSPDSSQAPGPHVDTVTPSAPHTDDHGSPGASPSSPATPAPSATTGSGDGTGAPDGTGGRDGTGDGTPKPEKSTSPADKDGDSSGAKIVKACKDFRAGRIDESAKRRLAQSARTGETVRRFCDRILAEPERSDGTGDGGSRGDDGGWSDSRTVDRTAALSATPARVIARNQASTPAPTRLGDLLGVPSMNTV